MMTAQERKDFRRVQKSREVWKKRAVRRGEDRRRLQERRKEVESSREAWRERALAAEQRTRQLEIENHQLTSALAQASQPTPIDTSPFFSAISFSISCLTVPSRSERLAKCSVPFSWWALA
jgi:hypothetical protein